MKRPIIKLIAAMSKNRTIGYDGQIPWHISADLARFKALTLGKTVIMGRKTFESIGKALPDRDCIVVTNQMGYVAEGVKVAYSISQATILAGDANELWIIGGAELYRQTIEFADVLYLTEIESDFPGDAFFPEFDTERTWLELNRENWMTVQGLKQGLKYSFVEYVRRYQAAP